jgi:predicted ATPase/DNA-binding SARP family transcriptional activator
MISVYSARELGLALLASTVLHESGIVRNPLVRSSQVHASDPEIHLLGPVEVLLGNEIVNVGGRRQRSVLAQLALHVNRVVSTSKLNEGVWGEAGLDRPPNTLQVYIYNLRRILEPTKGRGDAYQLIVSRDPGYSLQLAPELVDSARFEAGVVAARGLRRNGDGASAIGRYREAESCWHGSALEDLVFEPFAAAEANRLETMRLDALEERIELQLQMGRHDDLVGELESLVRGHPFREGLRAKLMLCLYRCQRQADALKTFDEGQVALLEQLGLDPGPRLIELRIAVLNHDPGLNFPVAAVAASAVSDPQLVSDSSPTIGPPRPLPRPLTNLIGRRDAIGQVVGSVEANAVTTLVGAAGCGKSRAVLAAAAELAPSYPGGVFVIDLAAVDDDKEVDARVCQELGVQGGQALSPGGRITEALHNQVVLIVLDNCDRVIDATAKLAAEIASDTSRCRLLLTSRESLRVPGEVVIEVRPLRTPPPGLEPTEVATYEAVELFIDRAQSVDPLFQLDKDTIGAVVGLVTYLDGLPLAIELVASRLRSLSAEELSLRLGERLKLLDLSHRTPDIRQQTLRTTIDWSYDLLTDAERTTLCQLSVFTGGWTLAAAERVWTPGSPADDMLDVFDRLVGKSLVSSLVTTSGRRYRMQEIVREYALQKLDDQGIRCAVERRVAKWCLDFAEGCASNLAERVSTSAIDAIEIERANLLPAASWLLDNGEPADGLRIVEILTELWIRRGRWSEARTWITRAIAAVHTPSEPVEDEAAGRLMASLATVCTELGDETAAQQWASQAVSLFEKRSLPVDAASALCVLGRSHRAAGDLEGAESLAIDARNRFRTCGNSRGEAIALRDLGVVARLRGDNRRARALLEEGLALFRDAKRTMSAQGPGRVPARGISEFVNQLGSIAEREGDIAAAHELLNEGFDLANQRGNIIGIAESLISLGYLSLQRGSAVCAGQLLGAVGAMCVTHQTVLSRAAESGRRGLEGEVTGLLGLDASEAAQRAGAALAPNEVVELALSV